MGKVVTQLRFSFPTDQTSNDFTMTDVFSKMTETENLRGKGKEKPWNLENGALEDWERIFEAAIATASTSKSFPDWSTKTDEKTDGVNQENHGLNKEVNTN